VDAAVGPLEAGDAKKGRSSEADTVWVVMIAPEVLLGTEFGLRSPESANLLTGAEIS
jgi:hypothetical protein